MRTVSELIFDCRTGLSALVGITEAQIPLSFFHLLNFTMNVYCVLFAYSLCFVATWFCWITVIVYTVAMLGLREVSIMLAEPFGDDPSDINLKKMLLGGFKTCAQIISMPPVVSDFQQAEESWNRCISEMAPSQKGEVDKMGDPIPPKTAQETDHLLGGQPGDPTSSAGGSGDGYGTGHLRDYV